MLSKKDRSNLAGEFHTLAELYRRGYNAFITLGKSKQIEDFWDAPNIISFLSY